MDILSTLPNEILIKIFENCKVLRLTQVSKKFNELVSNTPSLMKKIQLLITEKTVATQIVKSERQYQNILIKFNYQVNYNALDIVARFGSDIKQLEMMRCIVYEDVFYDILEALPNIETLSIFTTFLKIALTEEREMPELTKLQKLTFRNSDQNILNYFKNSHSLKNINLAFLHNQPIEVMTNFLQQHPEIEETENLMVSTIDDSLMSHVMNLSNLKKLSLEIDKMNVSSIQSLELENSSVEFLNLYGNVLNPADFNTLLKIFKGVTSLEIEMNNNLEPLNIHQLNSMKISSLNFNHCQGNFFNELQIQSLKVFTINDALSITYEDWILFASRNPNIEVLKIKDESITNEVFAAITQDLKNLKHFELFFDPQRLTLEILNFICDHLPNNVKILKISERIPSNQKHFIITDEQKEKLKHKHGFKLYLS